MTPFYTRFPEIAAAETRVAFVPASGGPLPRGEYGFIELYCDEPDCDCRRVLVQVAMPQAPDQPLAFINYGWESLEFYTEKCHGDVRAARETIEASLDPLNRQSKHARQLLNIFRATVKSDPAYVARLARHYQMFKSTQAGCVADPSPVPPEESDDAPVPLLTIPEILEQFRRIPENADFAPYEAALRAARAQREAIIPELIAAMDRVTANPKNSTANFEETLHEFAIYLLAEFREPRALDCFWRFFSMPEELALDLSGDMVTEEGAAVLASVCGGNPAPLLKLVRNESVNEYVRIAALDGLMVQAAWGERPREAVIEDLRGLFVSLPRPGNPYVWAALVSLVCDFRVLQLVPQSRQAFAENLVALDFLGLDDFEKDLSRKDEEQIEIFCERNAPIDVISVCQGWACFGDEEDEARDFEPWDDKVENRISMPDLASDQFARDIPSGEAPYVAPPKVGRNDPCPCGSGKKFKKCCGK